MLMTDKNLLFGRQVAAAEVLKGVQQFCHCEVPGIGMFIRVVHKAKSILQDEVSALEEDIQHHWSKDKMDHLIASRTKLMVAIDNEEKLLHDKARIRLMLKETRTLVSFMQLSRTKPKFFLSCDDGSTISDAPPLQAAAEEYFSKIFTTTGYKNPNTFLDCVPSLVDDSMNDDLCKLPLEPEIFNAVKSLSAYSSPGPDGYTGLFYKICWNIIKLDVTNAVQDLFRGGHIPQSIASTLLVLIPPILPLAFASPLLISRP